jgi:catechol 2,3-dioxygenase-like lactoylglutathione lyase family enzyme
MVTFGRVAPSIYVRDLQRSLDFYCDILGFSVVFTNGSPICIAILKRDAANLNLCLQPERAGLCHAHILLDDLDSFYAVLLGARVEVRQPPKVQEWGLRDIVVADPDGNTFEFAEVVGEEAVG